MKSSNNNTATKLNPQTHSRLWWCRSVGCASCGHLHFHWNAHEIHVQTASNTKSEKYLFFFYHLKKKKKMDEWKTTPVSDCISANIEAISDQIQTAHLSHFHDADRIWELRLGEKVTDKMWHSEDTHCRLAAIQSFLFSKLMWQKMPIYSD